MFTIIGADHKEYGPASAEEIQDWIKQGRADGRTLARADGGEWKPLSAHPEFANFTAAAGAPPRSPATPGAPAYENGPAAVVIGADPDFEIGDCLNGSWNLLRDNFGLLVGASTLIWLLNLVAQWIPFAAVFLWGILYGGLYLLFLKCIRREPVGVGDALAGFSGAFVQLLLAGFLISFLTYLGACFCLIPAIYLKIAWSFALALVIDKRLEFWTAMELSRKVATRVWFKVLALTLIVFAPYIIVYCLVEAKLALLMYPEMSAVMSGGAPDFKKWLQVMQALAGKIQFLLLAIQLALLVTLPFGVGALMYAYEALFGARPAKAA